jgi:hypothetical protein
MGIDAHLGRDLGSRSAAAGVHLIVSGNRSGVGVGFPGEWLDVAGVLGRRARAAWNRRHVEHVSDRRGSRRPAP